MLRVDTVKFLADGGLSGATAALSVPYRHLPTQGPAALRARASCSELCGESAPRRLAHRHPRDRRCRDRPDARHLRRPRRAPARPVAPHRALRPARRGAARARGEAARHRRAADDLHPQPRPQLPLRICRTRYLPRTYPIRAMLDAGVRVALSSDAPVVEDDNPLVGMMAAVTRLDNDRPPHRAGAGDHDRRGAARLHDGRRDRDRRRRTTAAASKPASGPTSPC